MWTNQDKIMDKYTNKKNLKTTKKCQKRKTKKIKNYNKIKTKGKRTRTFHMDGQQKKTKSVSQLLGT